MRHWRPALMPDLHGLRAIVTGSNSGIGRSAARELARRGAHVVLACRNLTRAEEARAGILSAAPGASVEVAELDLASLTSVRAFARQVVEASRPVDILINNAGRMVQGHRQTTQEGFELTFGANHLGPFALTGLLLPVLLEARAARVVTVASIAHKGQQIPFDDLQSTRKYRPTRVYGQSKLANLMFGLELDRRFRRVGVQAMSIVAHPGVSSTGFIKNAFSAANPIAGGVTGLLFNAFGQSEDRGAFPLLFAATAPQASGGHYYGPDGFREMHGYPVEVRPDAYAADPSAAAELWRVSAELTGVHYDQLTSSKSAGESSGLLTGWMQDA